MSVEHHSTRRNSRVNTTNDEISLREIPAYPRRANGLTAFTGR